MPRYELDGEPWQIEQIGKQLEITSGGRISVRTFVTPEQAAAQLAKLVEERTLAGFQPMPRDPRHAELEAAIAADPENPAGYSVFADWLQSQGDIRGNVMAIAIAAEERAEGDAKVVDDKAFPRELKKHVHDLLGPLAAFTAGTREGDPDVFAWRFGVIHGAYLHAERQKPLDRTLDALLRHASGRFLVDLTLVQNDRIQETLDALAYRAPTSLRGLRLWAVSNVNLAALWPALPQLRRLSLSGHALALGELDLPALERLELVDSQMPARSARTLVRAPFPVLEQLRIDFGSGYTTGDASIDDIFALISRTDLPHLRQLALVRTRYIRELVMELSQSPVARQLEQLDLSHNQMTDTNAFELARRRANFPRLASLDVTGNRLTAQGLVALGELAATVRSVRQEP